MCSHYFFFIDKGSYLKISVSGAVCALSTLFSDLNSQTLHFGAKMLWTFKKWVTFFFLPATTWIRDKRCWWKRVYYFIIGIEVRSITNNKIIYGQNLKILRWDHISIKKNNGNKLLYLTFVPWTKIHVSVTSD